MDTHSVLEDRITILQNKLDALARIVQVTLVMNSTLALKPLLQYIMESATEIIHAQAASILLVDKNTAELFFAAAIGSDADRLIGMHVPMEGSVAGYIVQENRAVIIDDTSSTSIHYKAFDEQSASFRTQSILGVPLRQRDKLIGVLEVLNKVNGRFTDDDVRHITILASQAAGAIENAQLLASLKQANEELANLNKLKSDFISIASHELRTPLGVILGYASFLKEEAQGEAGEHADMVLNSALHLRSLIEDMTNLRYVQVKESEMAFAPTQVSDILSDAYAEAGSLAEVKEQALLLDQSGMPIYVRADRRLLSMALSNVLNNAVKFTPQRGVIIVSAQLRSSEVWIMVKDNGVGLPTDQLERIFDQFYQAEDPMTRRHNGMGLGLTITRAVVQRHDGRVWAESGGPGLGATFTIALPLITAGSVGALAPHVQATGPLPDLGIQ